VERKDGLAPHKLPFAHEGLEPAADLHAAIRQLRPTALVGVSTVKGAFDRQALQLMAEFNVSGRFALRFQGDEACVGIVWGW
jgi:malate dehydrogenase (oxaloacetate-decarboxylating)(NADP+)